MNTDESGYAIDSGLARPVRKDTAEAVCWSRVAAGGVGKKAADKEGGDVCAGVGTDMRIKYRTGQDGISD